MDDLYCLWELLVSSHHGRHRHNNNGSDCEICGVGDCDPILRVGIGFYARLYFG